MRLNLRLVLILLNISWFCTGCVVSTDGIPEQPGTDLGDAGAPLGSNGNSTDSLDDSGNEASGDIESDADGDVLDDEKIDDVVNEPEPVSLVIADGGLGFGVKSMSNYNIVDDYLRGDMSRVRIEEIGMGGSTGWTTFYFNTTDLTAAEVVGVQKTFDQIALDVVMIAGFDHPMTIVDKWPDSSTPGEWKVTIESYNTAPTCGMNGEPACSASVAGIRPRTPSPGTGAGGDRVVIDYDLVTFSDDEAREDAEFTTFFFKSVDGGVTWTDAGVSSSVIPVALEGSSLGVMICAEDESLEEAACSDVVNMGVIKSHVAELADP